MDVAKIIDVSSSSLRQLLRVVRQVPALWYLCAGVAVAVTAVLAIAISWLTTWWLLIGVAYLLIALVALGTALAWRVYLQDSHRLWLGWSLEHRQKWYLAQGYRFLIWFAGHNLLWVSLSVLGSFLTLRFLGLRSWTLAVTAAALACALYSLLGLWSIQRPLTLAVCWSLDLRRTVGYWTYATAALRLNARHSLACQGEGRSFYRHLVATWANAHEGLATERSASMSTREKDNLDAFRHELYSRLLAFSVPFLFIFILSLPVFSLLQNEIQDLFMRFNDSLIASEAGSDGLGSGTRPGNRPSDGTQPGDQPGGGTELGNQPGGGTQPGDQPGSGTEPGNQPGGGTESGDQPGSGTESGDQPGGGTESGDPSGGGTESGDQPGGGTESGDHPGSGTESGDQPGGGTESGDQPGSGTEPGDQPGGGTESGDQPGSGTESGDQPGGGTESGDQPGGGTESGDQPGGGTESGDQPGGGTESGDQPGGGTESGDQPGGGTEPGDQPGGGTQPGDQPGGGTKPGTQSGEGTENEEQLSQQSSESNQPRDGVAEPGQTEGEGQQDNHTPPQLDSPTLAPANDGPGPKIEMSIPAMTAVGADAEAGERQPRQPGETLPPGSPQFVPQRPMSGLQRKPLQRIPNWVLGLSPEFWATLWR